MPYDPYGYIGDRWRVLGGEHSDFGIATSDEYDVNLPWGSPGRARDFANGQIVFSPRQGTAMLVSAFAKGNLIVFEWGMSDPFHYDSWIVRWSVAGGAPIAPNAQEDVPLNVRGRGRNYGFFHTGYPDNVIGTDGKRVGVSFIVEGYDGEARQGWTCPIFCRL